MRHDIADQWDLQPLIRVATLQRGFDLPIQNRKQGLVPVYGSNGVDGLHNSAAVAGPGVITGRSGTIGRVYYEQNDYWPLNTTLYVRDFHGNEPRFVARLLESLNLSRFSASTGVPSLNRNFVHPELVRRPPVGEQIRIASVLMLVDEAIEHTGALINKLRQIRVGLLRDLLTRGLNENGQFRATPAQAPHLYMESPLGTIPKNWEVKTVGSLCELLNGLAFKPEDWSMRGTPIIRIQNLNGGQEFNYFNGSIDPKYIVEPGTLLFSWSGNRGTSFGPYIWSGPIGVLNQHIFKVTPAAEIHNRWLYLALDVARERAEREAHGGSGLVHVRRDDLLGYAIATPLHEEQTRIADRLAIFDAHAHSEDANLEKLKQIKLGLTTDLLSGDVRVLAELELV